MTNPERFRPLHKLAVELLEQLEAQFDVSRDEVFELPPHFRGVEQARTPIRLTPAAPAAAPIAVLFTTFPSLVVRFGRWLFDTFPSCGCDACDEIAEGEGERLREGIGGVVAGHFREEVRIPLLGGATRRWELGPPQPRTVHRSGWERISRAEARALIGDGPRVFEWRPWPRRPLLSRPG